MEGTGFPFSIAGSALKFAEEHGVFRCIARGCESEVEMTMELTDEPCVQHFVLYDGDTPDEREALGYPRDLPRIIKLVREVVPGVWAEGVALEKYDPTAHYENTRRAIVDWTDGDGNLPGV